MVLLRDTDDEDMLRSTFRNVFAKYADEGPAADSSQSRLWTQLSELGTLDMAIPEAHGGGGATLAQLCVVAEEAGRDLRSAGLVEHLVATRLLGELAPERLVATATGDATATLALRHSRFSRWQTVVSGPGLSLVLGVHDAHVVALRLVPSTGFGHAIGPLRVRDVTIDDTTPTRLAPESAFSPTLDAWRTLTAAYLVGISESVLSRTVAYVGDRWQFERPIGSYQVVQQGLAELPGMINGARLLMAKAAWSLASGDPAAICDPARNDIADRRVFASMAFLFAAETATLAVDRSLHYHGATGATSEYGIGDFYQVARSLPLMLGPLHIERRRLADLLLESKWTSR